MIPDWLMNITQAVMEWHGSLPDWLALLTAFIFACFMCCVCVVFLWRLEGGRIDKEWFGRKADAIQVGMDRFCIDVRNAKLHPVKSAIYGTLGLLFLLPVVPLTLVCVPFWWAMEKYFELHRIWNEPGGHWRDRFKGWK